jgi:hypothetical protein
MDLQTLSSRVTELANTLSGAKARRAALALPALAGNKAAVKEIAEIDAQLGEIKKESALLSDGIEQLKLQAAQQQQQAVDKERQKREIKAAKIGETILGLDAEIDATLARLRQMFEQRRALAGELRRTNTCDPHLVMRLHQRYGPTAAAYAAGLREFIGMELVVPEQVRPLVKSDNWLTWPRKGTDSQELGKQGNSHGDNQTQIERSDSHDH